MTKMMGLAAAALAASSLTAMMMCSPADAHRPAATAAMQTASIHTPAYRVSEEAARRIAWRSGMDHVEEILLVDERWEVAGRDRNGTEVTVDIHAQDGRILDHDPAIGN